MKIAFLVQNLSVGGIQRLVVDDANEMYRRGEDVRVVYFEKTEGETLEDELKLPASDIVYLEYPRMRSVRSLRRLVGFLRKEKPDVVFAHHWFAGTVGRIACALARVRVVPFEHSDYSSVYSKKQLFIDRLLQYLSDKIIAVSGDVRDSLVRRGISAKRVVVVPNGTVLERFASVQRKTHEGFRFVFIGRLVSDKCVGDILHALKEVPAASLTIAGDGPESGSLKNLADELGVGGRIEWKSAHVHSAEVLSEADCLVLPSRREGFGLAVVEALAAGVPVIVSETANASGAVESGANGYVVPTGDVGALSFAMERMTNKTEYGRLQAGTRKGLERFSIEKHVTALLALCRSV